MIQRIGPYRVEGEIGRGGMGVVYRAFDERLGRHVAIKALPPELAADPTRLERFEREARTLASLNHPNLGAIYGVEEQDGHRYLILELIEGETLADRLDRGALPVDEAVEVCAQIAAGIEAAHDAGVIHRDLKPSNIKITPDGRVKVLDFGLARGDSGASSSGSLLSQSPTLTTPLAGRSPTVEGAILGTAAYMSPEQARGRGVDRRTDVWAFGVILFECLTGVGPFVGETATDSIGAVLHKEVDLAHLPAATPRMVRHVLARCLERDKARRFRDIADVRIELERAMDAPGEALAPAIATRGVRSAAMLGWGVALVAIAAALWFGLLRTPEPQPIVRTSIVMPEGRVLLDFAISPDGQQLAIVTRADDDSTENRSLRRLSIRRLGSNEFVTIPGTDGVHLPSFSPDGRTLAYLNADDPFTQSGWGLHRVPADLSSAPVELMRVSNVYRIGERPRFCWTPDGQILMLSQSKFIYSIFDAGTGREIRTEPLRSSDKEIDLASLLHPFGEHWVGAVTQRFDDAGYHLDTSLLDIRTGEMSRVVPDAGDLVMLGPDRVLFARSSGVYTSGFDPEALELRGEVRAVETGLATASIWDHGLFVLASNGTLVYIPGTVYGSQRHLYVQELGEEEVLWEEEARDFVESVAISPDGKRLAVIVGGPLGVYELWVSEVDQPRLRRLLAEAGTDFYSPVFTPDGERIICPHWDSDAEEQGQLLMVDFDGTEPPTRLYGGWGRGEWIELGGVSPDASHVLVHRYNGGEISLLEVALDGSGQAKELIKGRTIFDALYAPGEHRLLGYISDETGRAEAYVRRIGDNGLGPAIPVTTRGASMFHWQLEPDGTLAFRTLSPDMVETIHPLEDETRLRFGEGRPTGRVATRRNVSVDVALDGRAVIMRKGENEQRATRLDMVQGFTRSIGSDE